jgi:hypothetical protein
MAAGFFAVIGTALLGAAGTLGAVAFQASATNPVQTADDIRLMRCVGLRGEFTHTPNRMRPVWVLVHKGAAPESFCSGDGNEPPPHGEAPQEPLRFERVPGVVGASHLLV